MELQKNIKKIYLTASGGPFLNYKLSELKNITPSAALKHPKWKMGKKISIDSATLMNKVFEVIEAKNIFNLPYNKISILTHPNSYIHAIVKFGNGLTKILVHDPDMKIPIYNSQHYLMECLRSIKPNLQNQFEVILHIFFHLILHYYYYYYYLYYYYYF